MNTIPSPKIHVKQMAPNTFNMAIPSRILRPPKMAADRFAPAQYFYSIDHQPNSMPSKTRLHPWETCNRVYQFQKTVTQKLPESSSQP